VSSEIDSPRRENLLSRQSAETPKEEGRGAVHATRGKKIRQMAHAGIEKRKFFAFGAQGGKEVQKDIWILS